MDKENNDTDVTRTLKEDVLRELATFLKRRNGIKKIGSSFFDRPIILTLIGTVFVSAFSTVMHTKTQKNLLMLQREQRLLDQRYEIFRSYPKIYHQYSNALFKLLNKTIEVAKRCDGNQKETDSEFKKWVELRSEAFKAYTTTEPVKGILAQMEILYLSDSVRTKSETIDNKFDQTVELCQQLTNDARDDEVVHADALADAISKKESLAKEIRETHKQLLVCMSEEMLIFSTAK